MMVIGMMLIGTTTVFGKTTTTVNNNRHGDKHAEVIIVNTHDKHFDKTPGRRHINVREMDRRMVNHMLDGRHIMDRHGDCKVCHMNRHEIIRVERELRSMNHGGHNHFAR